MSVAIDGFKSSRVVGPRGPWSRLDNRPVPKERGSLARNVRFELNRVKSRDGFAHDFATSGKVTSFYHWITNDNAVEVNRIVYYESEATLKMRNVVDGSTVTLLSQAGRSVMPAEAGSRLYVGVTQTSGIATSQARVINALIGGAPADKAFAGPMTAAPVITETGAGNCSAGDHKFGYILESRTGFTGKPGPYAAGVFTPVTFTVTAGGKTLNMAVTATTPTDAAYLHPIMTRRDNPDRWYFVPDASVAIPANTAWTANMTIDIADETLADSAEECSENFDLLTQDTSGNGPFNPFKVVAVGQRMMYLTPQKLYISDQKNYQYLTEIEHSITLPGQIQIVTAFPMRGNIYVLGPSWTYAFSMSDERPRFWGDPEVVSGTLGTTGTNAVCWRTGGDYAWVANSTGLYRFDGQYDPLPVSYMNKTEWDRINWAAPWCMQIVDDPVNNRVYFSAPLDGATEPTHLMTWDYSRGFTWSQVDFSLDNLPSSHSSIGMVMSRSTGQMALWAGPAAAGNMLRQVVDQHDDAGTGFESLYETSYLVPAGSKWRDIKLGAAELQVTGEGDLAVVAYGKNRRYSETLESIALEVDPSDDQLLGADFNDDNVTIRVSTSGAGDWFDLSTVTAYFVDWMQNA